MNSLATGGTKYTRDDDAGADFFRRISPRMVRKYFAWSRVRKSAG
jgi:hypothetical protein